MPESSKNFETTDGRLAWAQDAGAKVPLRQRVYPFLPESTDDSTWFLTEEGFALAREHEVESLFSIANGYFGSRGSLGEGSPLSAPAMFVAGVFVHDGVPGAVPAPLTPMTPMTPQPFMPQPLVPQPAMPRLSPAPQPQAQPLPYVP